MKPHVICHMLGPLDGRLLVDAWAPDGSPLRKQILDEYQRLHGEFAADAWLAGTTTMKEFAKGQAATATTTGQPSSPPVRPWHLADAQARHFAIAIDRKARLHWDTPTADDGHVVVVLSASAPDAHLAELAAAGVSYLVMPNDEIDLREMLSALNDRLGIRTVLLEGGGRINGALLQAGVVDEISLLLAPAIDGSSGSPAIFEAGEKGLGGRSTLELMSAQPVAGGAVHLRYRVVPK